MITRRDFLKTTAGALGATALLGRLSPDLRAAPAAASRSFGFQTWTLREQLGQDLPGTLKMMVGLGYRETEFCSPYGYTNTPFEKFNPLSGGELRRMIADSGLKCESSHFTMGELRGNLGPRIEWAHQMGLTQMICSSFWLPKEATLDDYRRACDELNSIAQTIRTAGLQAGFHNHNMEFERRGGQLTYDAMLERLDPALVKMQFQTAVIQLGFQAAEYFRKYPGRFISSHLSDWSTKEKRHVPIGQGVIDWKDFFAAAEVGGVKNFFVEMDPDTFAPSAKYLQAL